MYVQIKIYWEFYYGIVHVYIANERRHITIGDKCYVVNLKFNKVKYAMTTPIGN